MKAKSKSYEYTREPTLSYKKKTTATGTCE